MGHVGERAVRMQLVGHVGDHDSRQLLQDLAPLGAIRHHLLLLVKPVEVRQVGAREV